MAVTIENENSKFTMLGMPYSGKTCYIAGMYKEMTSGVNGFTLIAGDDIRSKLEREIRILKRPFGMERFPAPTSASMDAMKNYQFRMCYNLKELVSFEMEDYSGESLDKRDEVYQKMKDSVEKSTVLYIFIDGSSFCADSREERKKNVYYNSAMTLCPMIQDFADSHSGGLPPIVFVVTKADLCKKYVRAEEVVSVIKECFRPAFSDGTTTYISAVSLGENISDDGYKGEFSPFNIHVPFFIGCYHEYYNRFAVLQNKVTLANERWSAQLKELQDNLEYEERRWRTARRAERIEKYKKRISSINDNIQHNQQLLQNSKDMLIRFGTHLVHENDDTNFFYFKDGRQMDFREF